jgi:hypothetical protein
MKMQTSEHTKGHKIVLNAAGINFSLRKSKEQTPEFSGSRGLSIDSFKRYESGGLDNSLNSEEYPKE